MLSGVYFPAFFSRSFSSRIICCMRCISSSLTMVPSPVSSASMLSHGKRMRSCGLRMQAFFKSTYGITAMTLKVIHLIALHISAFLRPNPRIRRCASMKLIRYRKSVRLIPFSPTNIW